MRVTVQGDGDKVLCELNVEARDQVRSLKQRLSTELGIEAHRIRLQYEEHELEYDGRTVAQYGIQDGGALQMSECARPKRVLLAASGSVAAVKVPPIATQLRSLGFEVKVVTTDAARHFFELDGVLSDADEWSMFKALGDPVFHIDLREWADVLLIAPLSANTMGKIANGLCDNLVTCIARAWDFSRPFVVAPAMNTHMWTHPHTAAHVAELERLQIRVISPVAKRLACGDTGTGALASVDSICAAVVEASESVPDR